MLLRQASSARFTEVEPTTSEAAEVFPCFGSTCTVLVMGHGPAGAPQQAAARTRQRLRDWHEQFSRFLGDSELSRLNGDTRETVPVSLLMRRVVGAVASVGGLTGGLVDGTLVAEIEHAGYGDHFDAAPIPLHAALAIAPPRQPAGPSADPGWRKLAVDEVAGTVTRPSGLRIDSGGIAKGLFADALANLLAGHPSFAVDCAGDVRLGGNRRLPRAVNVESPFDGSILHTFTLCEGAAATSGIGKRSWLDGNGRAAHHLLDPATGQPAFTGIVQVTALAPTGVIAEARAKAALLSGPAHAERWLTHGGLIVYDDGSQLRIEAR